MNRLLFLIIAFISCTCRIVPIEQKIAPVDASSKLNYVAEGKIAIKSPEFNYLTKCQILATSDRWVIKLLAPFDIEIAEIYGDKSILVIQDRFNHKKKIYNQKDINAGLFFLKLKNLLFANLDDENFKLTKSTPPLTWQDDLKKNIFIADDFKIVEMIAMPYYLNFEGQEYSFKANIYSIKFPPDLKIQIPTID